MGDHCAAAPQAGRRAIGGTPLCITAAQCRAILAVAKKSRGRCLVAQNAPYSAAETEIRRILKAGTLDRPLFMSFDGA